MFIKTLARRVVTGTKKLMGESGREGWLSPVIDLVRQYLTITDRSNWMHWHDDNDIDTMGYLPEYDDSEPLPKLDPVQILPAATVHDLRATITLLHPDEDAVIVYTIDGTDPIYGQGVTYVGPFVIEASAAVKARAYAEWHTPSDIVTRSYTIQPRFVSPDIIPADQIFEGSIEVTMSCDAPEGEPYDIYYTDDGSTPTTASAHYDAAILIEETTTLKAVAIASGYCLSNVTMRTYQKAVEHYLVASQDDLVLPDSLAGSIEVGILSNTSWLCFSSVEWISVVPLTGSGDATILVSYDENLTLEERVGVITIRWDEDYTFNITQPAMAYLEIDQDNVILDDTSAGGMQLDIAANIAWSIDASAAWISCEPDSGVGSAAVTITYGENTTDWERVGYVVVSGLVGGGQVSLTQPEANPNVRNVIVVYAQHEISLEDPLAPGEYNDTATDQYRARYKWLGLTVAQWLDADFDNPDDDLDGFPRDYNKPPLSVYAELWWKQEHQLSVTHIGLNTEADTIDPYIVPVAQHPSGYYVSIEPQIPGLSDNENGWKYDGSTPPTNDTARIQQLLIEILESGYLEGKLDPERNYCKNVPGKIDYLILATPQLYKHDYYWNDRPGGIATVASAPMGTVLAGQPISRVFYQPGGWPNLQVHTHEYIHTAFQHRRNIDTTAEVFADKDGDGEPIKLTTFIPDVYCASSPLPSSPWSREPCSPCMHRSFRPVLHPLMTASFGLTTLNRWAKASGTYTIGNTRDTWDFLCLQSPYDLTQFMILSAFYPAEYNGSISYQHSGNEPAYNLKTGVYATIVKPRRAFYVSAYYEYANTTNPITNHMVDTMTEQYQYGNIGMQPSRYNYTDINHTNPLQNKTAVLLDHDNPVTNPSGLTLQNDPFGVLVEWVGWSQDENDVWRATVNITIDEV